VEQKVNFKSADEHRKELISIKCDFGGSVDPFDGIKGNVSSVDVKEGYQYEIEPMRLKRQAFPVDFKEPE
jgi:hypothetical protein